MNIQLISCLVCTFFLFGCSQSEIKSYKCDVSITEQANTGDPLIDSQSREYNSTTVIKIDKLRKTLDLNGIICDATFRSEDNSYRCEIVNSKRYKQFVKIEFFIEDMLLRLNISSMQRSYTEAQSFLDLTKVDSNGSGSCKEV